MVIGRFKDGTPLALSGTSNSRSAQANDFMYGDAVRGPRCPMHSHMRKLNPRGDRVRKEHPGATKDEAKEFEEELERSHRITRRAVPYGHRLHDPQATQLDDDLPADGVGLLFMCFQRSINNQFALIQVQWANAANFVEDHVGRDPLVGQVLASESAEPQQWPVRWDSTDSVAFTFGDCVTLKGGEFFFAPSIPFLTSPTGLQPPP